MHILLGFSATHDFVTMVKIGPHVHPKPEFALFTPLHGLVPFSSPGLNHPSLPSFPLAPPLLPHGNASCCSTFALRTTPWQRFALLHHHDGASRRSTSALRTSPRRRFAPRHVFASRDATTALRTAAARPRSKCTSSAKRFSSGGMKASLCSGMALGKQQCVLCSIPRFLGSN